MDEKKYTLEDIETLRSKTGVGYGEAVRLLEKYDGDIARALVELEKRGELGGGRLFGGKTVDKGKVESTLRRWWKNGCQTRIIVERRGEQLINLSALFMILALLLGWKLVLGGAVLALILGCHVRVRLPETEAGDEDGSKPQKPQKDETAAEAQPDEGAAAGEDEQAETDDGYKTIIVE